MIEAKIIAHSVNRLGKEIVTFELQYPRFIHGEVMTHRVFSRNAMSSRAVPVAKMIEQVRNNPAMPLKFMKNQPGMQSTEDLSPEDHAEAVVMWRAAANFAADSAEEMAAHGIHKQFANRLLEPFQWMRAIVTATEWHNFFSLRCHPDAQPEFQALAFRMLEALRKSDPVTRDEPDHSPETHASWHLPYVTEADREIYRGDLLPKLSAARCARVSYLTHDGAAPNVEADLALFDRLVGSVPLHASPIEHQAVPHVYGGNLRSNNFVGWYQFRESYKVAQ
jgi:Thymidylate synthase complementing protein